MLVRRAVTLALTLTAAAVLIAAVTISRSSTTFGAAARSAARGAAEELQEQQETTELREEAFAEAVAAGTAGRTGPLDNRPAPGWTGERLLNPRTDDWEPAVAADPKRPFVYILTTRYGARKACKDHCPSPNIILETSRDGGKTWSDGTFLCPCRGWSGQFDPLIEVTTDGKVYAVWMNDFNVYFSRSLDHGTTWSSPVAVYGHVAWTDKPALATEGRGKHVYISWNGPTGGDPWVSQSHDFGETWTEGEVVDSKRYYFAFDGDVLPDGTVIFSQSSFTYTGPAASAEGVVKHHAFISRDRGRTWENHTIDTVKLGPPCTTAGCYADFYAGRNSVSSDSNGDLVYLYSGSTVPGAPQRTWARRSSDGGRTWSARVTLSTPSENSTSPAVEAVGNGDVRAWYAETNGQPHAWNVWYRRSTDGGRTWSRRALLSDANAGARYKDPAGFREIYGDYGEIDVTSDGDTIAVWGEGVSWIGPGGTWFNLQR
jgi:Neuraminidase (sialidase)